MGHDHLGFDMVNIDGKLFLNPGAVSRLINHDKEIVRKPKVYIVTIDDEISIEEYFLKSAKEESEVLANVIMFHRSIVVGAYSTTHTSSDSISLYSWLQHCDHTNQ